MVFSIFRYMQTSLLSILLTDHFHHLKKSRGGWTGQLFNRHSVPVLRDEKILQICCRTRLSANTTVAAATATSLQSCPTLCDPIDGSPPGSPVPGILQARTLEWVAISFSNAWKWKVKVKSLSRVRPLATPWTAAYQAPLSMGFSRQAYWSGVPSPSPKLLILGINLT